MQNDQDFTLHEIKLLKRMKYRFYKDWNKGLTMNEMSILHSGK